MYSLFIRINVFAVAILLFSSCAKDVGEVPSKSENTLTKIEVYKKEALVQKIEILYNSLRLISALEIKNYTGTALRERVDYSYNAFTTTLDIKLYDGESLMANQILILETNELNVPQRYTVKKPGQDSIVFLPRFAGDRISAWVKASDTLQVAAEYNYSANGLEKTRFFREEIALPRTEELQYILTEAYEKGINEISILPELVREEYFNPPYLSLTGSGFANKSNFLPKTRTVYLNDDLGAKTVYLFDYNRTLEGRVLGARKFTEDIRVDERIRFFYE